MNLKNERQKKSLIAYVTFMAEEMRHYDISREELQQSIEEVEEDDLRNTYRKTLQTTGYLASFCDQCENEKIYIPSEKEYYCPVCS